MEKRLLTLLALAAFGMNTLASDKQLAKLPVSTIVATGAAQTPVNYIGTAAAAVNASQEAGKKAADVIGSLASAMGEKAQQANVKAGWKAFRQTMFRAARAQAAAAEFSKVAILKAYWAKFTDYVNGLFAKYPRASKVAVLAIVLPVLYKLVKFMGRTATGTRNVVAKSRLASVNTVEQANSTKIKAEIVRLVKAGYTKDAITSMLPETKARGTFGAVQTNVEQVQLDLAK